MITPTDRKATGEAEYALVYRQTAKVSLAFRNFFRAQETTQGQAQRLALVRISGIYEPLRIT